MRTQQLLLSGFMLMLACLASAQEKIVATAKNGQSFTFFINEKYGEQASNNYLFAHLINDGTGEDMAIILGYLQHQKRYWFSAEIQGHPVLYGNYIGGASATGGINILRLTKATRMPIRSFKTNPSSFMPGGYVEEYRSSLPAFSNINGGISFRCAYMNQLGGYGTINMPGRYFIDRLYALELGVGPHINFFRHIRFSYSSEYDPAIQRSSFFSIRSLVTFHPYYTYTYQKTPVVYYSNTNPPYYPPFDSSAIAPVAMVFRVQMDGRFMYRMKHDWGLAWRAGMMTNAFLNERFFYGGIGLYIGWGKQRQYRSENDLL
jgi:hypothetical protein